MSWPRLLLVVATVTSVSRSGLGATQAFRPYALTNLTPDQRDRPA
jgi:hypothetical protein